MLLHAHYDPATHGPIPADALAVTHRAIRHTATRLGTHPLDATTQAALWAAGSGAPVEGLRVRPDGVVDTNEPQENP